MANRPIPAGGRKQGGGERGKLGPRDCVPSHTANSFYLKTCWDSGWSTSAGRVAAKHRAHASDRCRSEAEATKGRVRIAPGESAPVKLLAAWAARTREGTKRRRYRVRALWGARRLEPHAVQGTLHTEQPGAWAVRTGKAQIPVSGGKPSVAGTRRVLPTHSGICLQRPALPTAGLNSQPKWEITSARLCQGRN